MSEGINHCISYIFGNLMVCVVSRCLHITYCTQRIMHHTPRITHHKNIARSQTPTPSTSHRLLKCQVALYKRLFVRYLFFIIIRVLSQFEFFFLVLSQFFYFFITFVHNFFLLLLQLELLGYVKFGYWN